MIDDIYIGDFMTKAFSLICLLFFMTGCYGVNKGAGYSVRINVDQHAKPKIEDIKLVTEYLDKTEYEIVKIKEGESWKVESYKIFLNDKEFDGLKHNYIMIVVEYSFTESNNKPGVLEKIEVRIGNTQEGSTPVLKQEIDLVADVIEKNLINRFGDKNLSIKRKIVTPM